MSKQDVEAHPRAMSADDLPQPPSRIEQAERGVAWAIVGLGSAVLRLRRKLLR